MHKEELENFVMHPDWPLMAEFIEGHFKRSTDINAVDVTSPASTVVGEVIASQKIAADLDSLMKSFDQLRANHGKKKITYD